MFTLIKFSGKMWYDAACITAGTFLLWKKDLADLHLRGWLDPQATFDAPDLEGMEHS